MDPSKVCAYCMRENAVLQGRCQYCGKPSGENIPVGVLPPGTILNGKYLLGMYLGIGGYGITYRALDLMQNRLVAIKEYRPKLFCERIENSSSLQILQPDEFQNGLNHFESEANILESLQGIPEIVRIFQYFRENNTAYYVMEFLDGETLLSYLKNHKEKIGFSESVKLLFPVILALDAVHHAGTFHRDVSPDNIFVCSDNTLKLIDFGASRVKIGRYENSFLPVEKEGYSPPEQHTLDKGGSNQGAWSDVYAMAGTIYRCTTGNRPPAASARIAGDPLEFPRGFGSGLSDAQIRVLEQNLSLNPKERCQSMLALAQALLSVLKEKEASELIEKYPAVKIKPESPHGSEPVTDSGSASREKPNPGDRFFHRFIDFIKKTFSVNSESGPLENSSFKESGLVLVGEKGYYKGSSLKLRPGVYTFGRNPDQCNMVFPMNYTNISRTHFVLTVEENCRARIEDFSTYGTWLNQIKLQKNVPVDVNVGDRISFGNTSEIFLILKE